MGLRLSAYSAKELAAYFVRRTTDSSAGVSMTEYAARHVERLQSEGRTGTMKNMKTAMRSVCRFAESEQLYFSDITVRFLQDYERWLLGNGVKGRGVSLYIGHIRELFNLARNEYNDEDRGDIQIAHYPFRKYKIPKAPEPEKRALTVAQIRAIRDYVPSYSYES
ncbi:MAG: phage integrase SAM-like domain-containing protein [Prevotellaceae bacterium]|nr:phage integrase SAM-like domain-containing protein [Prevotellaceae bacterium]